MYKRIVKIETWLSLLLLVAMFVLIVIQVISRYLFEHPFSWTEELARYAMIWMIFVASVHLTSTGEHIVITLIDNIVPAAAVKWVIALSYLIVASACLVLMVPGWTFVSRMFMATSPAMSIPMGWVYLASLSGMFLIMIQSLVNIILIARGRIDGSIRLDEPVAAEHDGKSI